MSFKKLNVIDPIYNALTDVGYTQPTEIQTKAIPTILSGKDVISCAQTGTGKTAAFAIPILQLLSQKPTKKKNIRALIVTPTRELALQIEENFIDYSTNLPLKSLAIFGGVGVNPQINKLKNGVDVLIATPGRLLDLVSGKHINLSEIEILVLDEADRMLDMGFVHDVKKIIKLVPKKRQTLFFSATMPVQIRKFALGILNKAEEITVTPVSSTAETVQQGVYFVEKNMKTKFLVDILNDQDSKTLIFTRTKHGADRLVKQLKKSKIEAAAIHGNKSQNARQRALEDFKNSTIDVLIATDIAARGIDIEALPFVVNYELPNVPETYVHRIGRTGRAGVNGNAVSLCATEEVKDLKNIQKLIGFTIPVINK